MTAIYLHVLIQQSKPTANLRSSGTAHHSGLYFLTWARSPSRETAAILTFKALRLSAFCKPNQGQTELSAQGPEHSSQRSFPVISNFAHLLSHSTWILKQGTYPGRQYWMFQKPAGSLPMPLLILTVFGFAKHYLCRTTAWYCLVNQAQSTDPLWPFMSCTTEGLRTWRDHQPHKSLSYQQQSLYSLPRESWGKCALQQKRYVRGAAEPTT